MTEMFLRKVLELLPEVNKEIWALEDEESINWLRTFKGRRDASNLLDFPDKMLTEIFHEEEGWLEAPIIEAPELTSRDVMEAVYTVTIERAAKNLGITFS